MTKYIFVTGGVVSGLGKGITAASLGRLLKARGLKVAAQKLDPYINVDLSQHPDVYHGLYALQHRGQESCGIVVNDDGVFSAHKELGLVGEVFGETELNALPGGCMAIGHVRYGTTGGNTKSNIQPMVVSHQKGNLALAHNGNLANSLDLRDSL